MAVQPVTRRRLTASGDAQARTAECTDGLACFAAINIVLFHFPIQIGLAGLRRSSTPVRIVSFFILLSGLCWRTTTPGGRAEGSSTG